MVLDFIMKALFPERAGCLICGQENVNSGGVCKQCEERIVPPGYPFCPVCGRFWAGSDTTGQPDETDLLCEDCLSVRMPYFAARSLGTYGGTLKDAIYSFKYQRCRSLADFFGLLLAERFLGEPSFFGTKLIVPVPLTREKEIDRGFNQSALVARKMGRLLGISVRDCLLKTRHTPSQSKLTRLERRGNVMGAYQIHPQLVVELQQKQVLLIDDIYTTGATVTECAGVLMKAGAMSVGVMTLASAILEKRGQALTDRGGKCRNLSK